MLRLRIIDDPLAPQGAEFKEVAPGGLMDALRGTYPVWPATARLYRGEIAVENDATPVSEKAAAEIEAATEGDYTVLVGAGDPVTAIITVVAVLAITAAILLLMPRLPTAGGDIESANNSLGQRQNKPRPGERIPEIFGRVLSVPEMLTYPITTFEDNVEVEVSFMCVGRGDHTITDVKDGDTPLELIAGAGADFYGPFTSPNSGAPLLSVGAAVDAPFRSVFRTNEVNGQELDAPNQNSVSGSGDIRFVAPNVIENSGGIDFTEYFGAGDDISLSGAVFQGTEVVLDATTQRMRFHADYRIEFETFDPSTIFSAGQTLLLENAAYAGQHETTGDTVYVDLSGRYAIDTVSATEIQLVIL